MSETQSLKPRWPFRFLEVSVDLDDETIYLRRSGDGTWSGRWESACDPTVMLDHLQCRNVIRALYDTGIVEGFADQT